MLKQTLERKPKQGRALFYIIIAVFIIAALYFVPNHSSLDQTHDVVEDIDSLYMGIQAIFYGDIEGFFDGLMGGIPVIALFLVLFSITHFLFAHVLKDMFGKKNIATVMAFVVSAYGFIDHRVYNYLLSLNAFAIGILVFFALLIMIWGFSDHAVRRVNKEFKGQVQDYKNNKDLKELIRADEKEIARLRKQLHE